MQQRQVEEKEQCQATSAIESNAKFSIQRTNNSITHRPLIHCAAPKIIVMRHGERVDELFRQWIAQCEKNEGYYQFDCNMPMTLNPLKRPLQDYYKDTPLTLMGNVMAQMVGRSLFVNNLIPALRCIQTASIVANMSNAKCKLHVEPGLFENNDVYQNSPKWLSIEALSDAGFNVNSSYLPLISKKNIWRCKENVSSYTYRINTVLEAIFKNESTNECILIVGHASTVDLVAGFLSIHQRFISEEELENIAKYIPYCGTAVFRRNKDRDQTNRSSWDYCGESTLPPITYTNFSSHIDHKFLTRNSFQSNH